MVRQALTFVFVAALGLAIWRLLGDGGTDVPSFFNSIWNVIYSIIDGIAQVITTIFNTLFGGK